MPLHHVRSAQPADAQAVVDLVNRIARSDHTLGIDYFPLSASDEAAFLRSADPTVYLTLLAFAEEQPQPLGVLTASRGTNDNLRHVSALAIAVAAESRRQGIGRSLLEAFFGWAQKVGVEKCTLSVLSHNAPARALFVEAGFSAEAVRKGQYRVDGRLVDEVLMACWLMGESAHAG